MDPAAALLRALNAVCCGNTSEAQECLEAYATWRDSSGFIPTWSGPAPGQVVQGDMLAQALHDALTLALAVRPLQEACIDAAG